MQPFFRINAAAETSGNQEDTVEIFGIIGDWWAGNDDSSFVNRIKSLSGKSLRVQINSFGGDLKAGLGIANFLRGSGKEVTTVCMGVAASAASLIFCAGTKRIMRAGSQLMVHNSAVMAYGNSADLEKTAEVLDGFDESMADFYAITTGADKKAVAKMMKEETWMQSEDAVSLGFATEKESDLKAVACAAPAFAYAFKHPSHVMPSASLSHPALLDLATLLASAPQSEADLVTGIKNFVAELSAARADLVTARASIQSLTVRAEAAEKAAADAQVEAVKVKASVDEEARRKAAEIVQAAALPSPVKLEKHEGTAKSSQLTQAEFARLSAYDKMTFSANGGRIN